MALNARWGRGVHFLTPCTPTLVTGYFNQDIESTNRQYKMLSFSQNFLDYLTH